MNAVDDDVIVARAYLNRVAEPGSVAVWAFVEQVGVVEAARAVRDGSADAGVSRATAARRGTADPHEDLSAARHRGIDLLVPEDDRWPHVAVGALERAARIAHPPSSPGARSGPPHAATGDRDGVLVPPLALWVRGVLDPSTLGLRSVAVVGARAATAYGEHVASDLAYGLARREVTVVSGGAHGIDAVAHRAALAAEGPTVLVAAGGLDRAYPATHQVLFDKVAVTGLLISESPPGAGPHRHRFLTRNRLIAAFGLGTVVVEAGLRSGAANTARYCFALGRPVMAVPGPVTSDMSAGCHALLRRHPEPALLVTGVADVLDIVGGIGEVAPPSQLSGSAGDDPRDRLDPVAQRVADALSLRRPLRPDDLAVRSGVPILEVIRSLGALEAGGVAEAYDGGYRLVGAARGS